MAGRKLCSHFPETTDLSHGDHSSHENPDVDQNHIDDVCQTGSPEPSDQGNSHKYKRGNKHTCLKSENIRKEGRQYCAASDVLKRSDNNLQHELADNSYHPARHAVMSLKKLGKRADLHLPVAAGRNQAHKNRSNSPGGVVPACRQAVCVGILGDSNG